MEGDSRQSKENSDQAITLHGQLEIASASTRSYSDSGYSSPSPATVTHTSAAQVRTTNFPFENASVDDSSATENIAGATVQDASQQSTKVAASVSFDISSPLPTADESPNNQFSSSRDSFIPAICSSMRRHSYDSLQSSLTPFRLVTELMQQRRCSDTQVPGNYTECAKNSRNVHSHLFWFHYPNGTYTQRLRLIFIATSALPKVSGTEDIDDESRSFTRPRSASSPLVVSLTNFGETLRNMGDRFEADHVTVSYLIACIIAVAAYLLKYAEYSAVVIAVFLD
jgi:hypothetical protein